MLRLVLSLTALIALAPSTFADVYRFVDKQGNVQYTDKPALLPAEKLAVQSRATDTAQVAARSEADRARVTAEEAARQQAAAQQADQRAASQLTATAKAEQCVKARERDVAYSTSKRLYESLPDGQRRYLTDAELTAARNEAKAAVAEMCN
jgi:Domain of unknown function (DUF4124)